MHKMVCQTPSVRPYAHSALLCILLLFCCALFPMHVQSSTSCSSVSSGMAFADDAPSCAHAKCTAPKIICCNCGGNNGGSTSSASSSSPSAYSSPNVPSPASTSPSSSPVVFSSTAPSSSPASSSSASGSTMPSGSYSSGHSSGDNCLNMCYSYCHSPSSIASASSSPYAPASVSSAAYNNNNSGDAAASSPASAPSLSSSSSVPSFPSASSSFPSASSPSFSSASSSSPAPSSSSSASQSSASSPVTSTALPQSSASSSALPDYPPEPCPCQLIDALLQFKYEQLNSSQQQVFEEYCLVQLRAILVDVSLSVEQKIANCGYVLRGFCAAHPDIGDKCKWVEVPGWGYVYDFAFMVAFAYEDELANSVCQMTDNSTGTNNLTAAISSGTSAGQCGNSSVWSGFVSSANRMNRRDIPTMSQARQLGWYFQVLELIYLKQYPTQEQCVRNISLTAGGYNGTVGQFLGLCDWYNTQSELLNSVLADSANATSRGDCPYVRSLQAGVSAANQSMNGGNSSNAHYNSSTVQEAQSFVDYCRGQFASVSAVGQRLQIVLAKFAQLSIQCRLLLKPIKIVGARVQCICADVVAIGNSCANGFACSNLTYGGSGESLEETCLVDGHNVSTLVEASQGYMNSLDNLHRLSYTSYHNAIRNCCYSSNYGNNVTARYQCAQYYVKNWAGNQASVRAVYNQVQLVTVLLTKVTSSNMLGTFFGTFGDFCQ